MSDMTDFADKALWAVASGTVGAQIMLWREHYAFRLEVAKKYADKEEIKEIVKGEIAPTNATLEEVRTQVASAAENIALVLSALQIEVPAVRKR
jgi:hypothetical protein